MSEKFQKVCVRIVKFYMKIVGKIGTHELGPETANLGPESENRWDPKRQSWAPIVFYPTYFVFFCRYN
jgi:hypothetical protein